MVEKETNSLFMGILVKVINAIGIEKRRTALDAVNFIAFVQKKLSEVSTVLAGNAGNESNFALLFHSVILHGWEV